MKEKRIATIVEHAGVEYIRRSWPNLHASPTWAFGEQVWDLPDSGPDEPRAGRVLPHEQKLLERRYRRATS